MTPEQFCDFLVAVIENPSVQNLWNFTDQGMPVFAHSMDVCCLVTGAYPDWRDRFPGFRLDVVLLGSVLHDLTKASARTVGQTSHSTIMERDPTIAVAAAADVLDAARLTVGVALDSEGIDHLWHVIAAHHGPWGKVSPHTPEASLLYHCDNRSATNHRLAPVDATDVLRLIAGGQELSAAAITLGVNRSVLKNRLRESVRANGLRTTAELVERWRDRGAVAIGDVTRARQIDEAKDVIVFAKGCPTALIERVRPLLFDGY